MKDQSDPFWWDADMWRRIVCSHFLLLLTACVQRMPAPVIEVVHPIVLSESEKRLFLDAVRTTPTGRMELDLAKKLRSTGEFKPWFSMGEIARVAYDLVLEKPDAMDRWRAVAKISSHCSGEYAGPYLHAREEALDRNPHLLDHCPKFDHWANRYINELGGGKFSPEKGDERRWLTDRERQAVSGH